MADFSYEALFPAKMAAQTVPFSRKPLLDISTDAIHRIVASQEIF